MPDPTEFLETLKTRLNGYDKQGAALVCEELVAYLRSSTDSFPHLIAEKILQELRNKRMFVPMQRLAEALIDTGRKSFKIQRQHVQALIDGGALDRALALADALIAETAQSNAPGAKSEYAEATGLRGRIFKQQYLASKDRSPEEARAWMQEAAQSYYNGYQLDPERYTWHGINVAALLHCASTDGTTPAGFPDYRSLAAAILETIENKDCEKQADAYDFATAAEACIALERPADAEAWIARFADCDACDAFELAGTLRQLEEVWRLDLSTESGRLVLPVLRTRLLQREGGQVVLAAGQIQKQKTQPLQLEKNFGNNVFIDFRTYKKGYACCEPVARIGRSALTGDGTGFLMKGSALCEAWPDELVLMTNAHVLSNDPRVVRQYGSYQPEEVIITFEALNRDEEFTVFKILWTSPPEELDVSILAFDPADLPRLQELTKAVTLYKIAKVLPAADGNQRVYVIGHPNGGVLQFSLQDNLLLDHQDPRIHYRTPTEGGNSGSPIFNQQWDLIGIHHGGDAVLKKLNGKEGSYEANEGLWIGAIKKGIAAGM